MIRIQDVRVMKNMKILRPKVIEYVKRETTPKIKLLRLTILLTLEIKTVKSEELLIVNERHLDVVTFSCVTNIKSMYQSDVIYFNGFILQLLPMRISVKFICWLLCVF